MESPRKFDPMVITKALMALAPRTLSVSEQREQVNLGTVSQGALVRGILPARADQLFHVTLKRRDPKHPELGGMPWECLEHCTHQGQCIMLGCEKGSAAVPKRQAA